MASPTFTFRIHPDALSFLEVAYEKQRKKIDGKGFSATLAESRSVKSFGAWVVYQVHQKTQADLAADTLAAADQARAVELDRKKAKPKVSGRRRLEGRKNRKGSKR